jgi:ubiquitin C-terminal hydrolase
VARNFLEQFSASGLNGSIPPESLDGGFVQNRPQETSRQYILRLTLELNKQVDDLKSRIKQFTDRSKYGYRLHRGDAFTSSVLIAGDVAHGHYWIYIYDFLLNKWFKYNDEQVTEVDEKVVGGVVRFLRGIAYLCSFMKIGMN